MQEPINIKLKNSGNVLPTFQDKLSVPSSGVKNGTDMLYRNVRKALPLLAA